jgi:hypothetical protein
LHHHNRKNGRNAGSHHLKLGNSIAISHLNAFAPFASPFIYLLTCLAPQHFQDGPHLIRVNSCPGAARVSVGRGARRAFRITYTFEVSQHIALYLVRIAQIAHMFQYETCDSEPSSLDGPRESVFALLALQLPPYGIKDALQPVERFRAARGRANLHETLLTPIRCVGGAGGRKSPLSDHAKGTCVVTLPASVSKVLSLGKCSTATGVPTAKIILAFFQTHMLCSCRYAY